MTHVFHRRIHGSGLPVRSGGESAVWIAAVVIATLLAIAILFLGVLVPRAI